MRGRPSPSSLSSTVASCQSRGDGNSNASATIPPKSTNTATARVGALNRPLPCRATATDLHATIHDHNSTIHHSSPESVGLLKPSNDSPATTNAKVTSGSHPAASIATGSASAAPGARKPNATAQQSSNRIAVSRMCPPIPAGLNSAAPASTERSTSDAQSPPNAASVNNCPTDTRKSSRETRCSSASRAPARRLARRSVRKCRNTMSVVRRSRSRSSPRRAP